jgi:hypothetical protein
MARDLGCHRHASGAGVHRNYAELSLGSRHLNAREHTCAYDDHSHHAHYDDANDDDANNDYTRKIRLLAATGMNTCAIY